jgi:adenylyltransferase/sulfurtransferase
VGPAAGVAASWQATLAIRYLIERDAPALSGQKAILEPWEGSARVVAVAAYPDCQVCTRGDLAFLRGEGAESATALCGREAVHIVPAADRKGIVNLESVASRLAPLGNVERRGRYLRFRSSDGYTLTLFEDGRGIFDGLTDPDLARNLYARLVGQ